MLLNRQLNGHVPQLGIIGDCFRTCIACFMNLQPSDVPNFMAEHWDGVSEQTNPTLWPSVQAWLAERGLTFVEIVYTGDSPLQEVLDAIAIGNGDDLCYMILGKSINANHFAIYRGNKLLWCPSDSGGIIGPLDDDLYRVYILASLRCRYTPGSTNEE